jgi:endonuclease/exonuclease/phosphatase family metal-dependent hydrolase
MLPPCVRYRFSIFALFVFFFSFGPFLFAQPDSVLRVMSFNIRFDNPADGYNAWPHRKELAASMIRFYDAGIVGLQEALRSQLDDLKASLPGYDWFGVARTSGTVDPEPDNEFSAILYRADRFERLDGSTFWLSPAPDSVGTKGWDAALPRVVTWARLRDRQSGATFYFFNTHFDHIGVEARAESAKLILRRIARIAGEAAPVILTGDFNAVPTEPPYRIITDESDDLPLFDALTRSAQPHHGPLGTWSGFSFPGEPGRRIDYIFVNDEVEVLQHAVLSDSWSGRFPSDHLPVLAVVKLK